MHYKTTTTTKQLHYILYISGPHNTLHIRFYTCKRLNCCLLYIFVNTAFISIKYKFRSTDTPTYTLVKPYFRCRTTFQPFQDLAEHTFVYI